MEKLSAAAAPAADGSRLRVFTLNPKAWPAIPIDTAVLLRLKGQAEAVGGFVVANHLDRAVAPHLCLRQLLGTATATVRRRAIQELGCYNIEPAAPLT